MSPLRFKYSPQFQFPSSRALQIPASTLQALSIFSLFSPRASICCKFCYPIIYRNETGSELQTTLYMKNFVLNYSPHVMRNMDPMTFHFFRSCGGINRFLDSGPDRHKFLAVHRDMWSLLCLRHDYIRPTLKVSPLIIWFRGLLVDP